MTLRAWRITKSKYSAQAFSGEGARLYGGRWTSPGQLVVYVSQTLSLATLEILVHLHSEEPLASYSFLSVEIPDKLIKTLNKRHLPPNWRDSPAPSKVRAVGDRWIREASSLVLKVPSTVIPHEHNFLINVRHPDFKKLVIHPPQPLQLDARLNQYSQALRDA